VNGGENLRKSGGSFGVVRDCVTKINAKVMKHLKQSRNDFCAGLDRPALKGLPDERYQYAESKA
jgi:hypothetical protein